MREHLVQLDHMGDILGEIDPTVGPWDLSHPASQTYPDSVIKIMPTEDVDDVDVPPPLLVLSTEATEAVMQVILSICGYLHFQVSATSLCFLYLLYCVVFW